MAEDYYKTLGIDRDASPAEIQKAYRELARKHHPDVNPDDKTAKKKFQEIQKAFDVLNDPEKRGMYDRFGSSFESRAQGEPQGGSPFGSGFGGPGFEDIDLSQIFGGQYGQQQGGGGGFGDIFSQLRQAAGGGRKQRKSARQPRRGADIRHEVQIPFGTAVTGGEIQITLQRQTGKNESITVKIPRGIEDGKKIRVRGQGEPPAGRGKPGDILITVRIAPHPCFTRRGRHLQIVVPITVSEAVLGGKIDVPTPQGTVSLSVPPGSSSGTKLRIKGHGVAVQKGTEGDLLAELQIVLPKKIDKTDKQLFRELAERYPQDPRADLRW